MTKPAGYSVQPRPDDHDLPVDLGIGTGHASVANEEKARDILGVPEDHYVAYLVGLGYPADRPLKPIVKPSRLPFDEVVRHGHW